MRRSRRTAWWIVYAIGSGAVLAGLGWISVQVARLEREEAMARAEVAQQETLRLALWRMDSWIAPILARESARTWFEYQSYYPETLALNRLGEPLAAGEVVVPSPLLLFRSELLPLHVQFTHRDGFTSPQLPSPEIVAQGLIGCVPLPPDPSMADRLRAFAMQHDGTLLLLQLEDTETRLMSAFELDGGDPRASGGHPVWPWGERAQSLTADAVRDFRARRDAASMAESAYRRTHGMPGNALTAQLFDSHPELLEVTGGMADIGPMVPLWLGSPPGQLLLARRVALGDRIWLQGAVVDWPVLRRELLERVRDLYPAPGAMLEPVAIGDAPGGGILASLPVRFVPPPSPAPVPVVGQGVAMGLAVVWALAISAIGATGLAMRATIRSALQTSRFASSVTHELRTPLTTFRLYAEMLADGMVDDPVRSREYLRTLRDESTRLGLLVENVLAWSRLEEGRGAAEARPVPAKALLDDAESVLRRRCEEAGAELVTRSTCDVQALADPSRVRQILFNLVDNACKYAGEHARVEVSAVARNGSVVLSVDDDGPGVPPELRERVFRAFDRGSLGPGDSVRGLGLGLSISLELANSLGGSLHCGESAIGGARFELALPRG
ncbi:MAG: HAMP domain-containing histidine kinase [Phycisphaeraceae bacterium]|nr:HAMP domain-containing histidine kinase [Phycisphaeraceae bacterium]